MKSRKNESVEQGVAPYGAQGAPPVNADVRINNNGLLNVQWTFHTVDGKRIDNAVTI